MRTVAGGGVNVLPVDHFTAAFLAIMEEAPDGGVFHIVNDRPVTLEALVEYGSRLFGLRGIEACRAEDLDGKPRNGLEALFDAYIEAYGPYMRDTRAFATVAAGPILAKHGLSCPEFDYGLFSKCMTYAVETGWGARLFPETRP
jgi:hypothetical protein